MNTLSEYAYQTQAKQMELFQNSFQRWAKDEVTKHISGYVECVGNRVRIWTSDGRYFDCYSYQGVSDTLARLKME